MRYILAFFLSISFLSKSQNTNDWVKTGKHLKIPVMADGLYFLKLSGEYLTNKENLRLINNGVPTATFIENDRLYFMGFKNTGVLDSALYVPVSKQPHQQISLFSDTAYYYLRIDPSMAALSMKKTTVDQNVTHAEAYHIQKETTLYTNEWTFSPYRGPLPALESAYFEEGETYTSLIVKKDSLVLLKPTFKDRFKTDTEPIEIELQINGRDNFNHRIKWFLGKNISNLSTIDSIRFQGFAHKTFRATLKPTWIENEATTVGIRSNGVDAFDRYSVNYLRVSYPQSIKNPTKSAFYHFSSASPVAARIDWPSPLADMWVIDLSATPSICTSTATSTWFTKTAQTRLFVGKPTEIITAREINLKPVGGQTANYLIISLPEFSKGTQAWAEYRASSNGGNYTVDIINVRDLYEQFNYGVRGPMGIKNYLKYLYTLQPKLERTILLVGQARSIYDNRFTANPEARDKVPSLGFPGSDNALSAGIGGGSLFVPVYATGRISTLNNTDILNYLDKVKEYEALPAAEWKKKILHLSGGRTATDIEFFKSALRGITPIAQQGSLGADVLPLHKKTTDPVEKLVINQEINSGAGMVTFFGHSSPNGPDIDIGLASDATRGYNNQGKYPLMVFNGCGVGNIYYGANLLSTNWLVTPKKGAVLILNHSYSGYSLPLQTYMKFFYRSLSDSVLLNQSFGRIHLKTLENYMKDNGAFVFEQVNALLMNIQGDPAIKIFNFNSPDYQAVTNGVFVQTGDLKTFAQSSTVLVGTSLKNLGRFNSQQVVDLQCNLLENGQVKQTKNISIQPFALKDTVLFEMPFSQADSFAYQIKINANQAIKEPDYANNTASLGINRSQIAALKVFPETLAFDKLAPQIRVYKNGRDMSLSQNLEIEMADSIEIQIEDNLALNLADAEVYLKACPDCNFDRISKATKAEKLKLSYTIKGNFKENTTYELLLNSRDLAGNVSYSEPIKYVFSVLPQPVSRSFVIYPNPAASEVQIAYQSPDIIEEILVEIFQLSGVKMKTLSLATEKTHYGKIPLEFDLPNGLFIFRLTNPGKTLVYSTQTVLINK